MVPDAQSADDVLQDTFCRAAQAGGDGPDDPTWGWLATVARNICIDRWRSAQQQRETPVPLSRPHVTPMFATNPVTPEAWHATVAAVDAISRAFETLTERNRRLLLLQAVEGWAYDDLARLEQLSPDAVKSALARARRAFRKRYQALPIA